MPQYALDLLKFIHGNLRVGAGQESCSCANGVPQGLTTSPMLFDIYTESLFEEI